MAELPTGTVTFLFTDIEGSTRLAQKFPADLPGALTRHHATLRMAIEEHQGVVFQIVGDAFCAAFPVATGALDSALAAQVALQNLTEDGRPKTEVNRPQTSEAQQASVSGLPSSIVIRVRMGIHTGEAVARDGQYHGYLTLSYTQRLMSAASGGQVLVSATSEALLRSRLPDGVTLHDLGPVTLKDFPTAAHIFEIRAPGLLSGFPPLRLSGAVPNNLPLQVTSLIGRERDVAAVRGLLHKSRIVTLTGAGGTGKTRLLLAVADSFCRAVPVEPLSAEQSFPDGVWCVELAPLSDPALVPQIVATTLGVREQPGRPIRETLGEHLRGQQVLLCLDNCEHLLDACAQLSEALLRAAPRLVIFSTSREALGLAGESTYRVPPLETPSVQQSAADVQQSELMGFAAVRLFVERATQINPSFRLTDSNARAVAQICERLDGIPLAIELAAARVKVLSPEQIAGRLDDRFRLLSGGTRNALAHHQTLRALIDWSYNLLSEPERALLNRLSIFAGGWTLEAAEAVCGEDGRRMTDADVLEHLSHLVEKSLVMVELETGETRYWLLETIRQYARERLRQSGESERVSTAHAEYYRHWSETAEPQLRGAEQQVWWLRVDAERANVRAAIDWSLHGGVVSDGAVIVCALWLFWFVHGYFSEAHALLSELLSRPELSAPSRLRALVLNTAGSIQARMPNAEVTAPPLFDEALQIARNLNDPWNIGVALTYLSQAALAASDYALAARQAEEGLALWRAAGDAWFTGMSLLALGDAAKAQGDVALAYARYQESAEWLRRVNEKNLLANPVRRLGYLALQRGDYAQAGESFAESLRLNHEMGELLGVACCIGAFAAIAVSRAQWTRAARLFGAMQATVDALNAAPPPNDQIDIEPYHNWLREQLPRAELEAASAEGRALTVEQAVTLALGDARG
jgi:predicted ATPase/class 3 adenylate cyclase